MQVDNDKVVSFHYTLRDDDDDVLDSSAQREPLSYLHGAQNIVPGLEKEMNGMSVGEEAQVTVQPAEGYGERNDELVQQVPREAFAEIGEVRPGMQVQAQTPQGNQNLMITEVSDDHVTVDGNHPLAGQTLHFDVEITDVREATEEEKSHGHVHD